MKKVFKKMLSVATAALVLAFGACAPVANSGSGSGTGASSGSETEKVEMGYSYLAIDGVTDADLQTEGEKYGVDAQKYALILTYLAMGGELDENDYSTVSIRELYSFIQTKQDEMKVERTAELAYVLEKFEKELLQTLTEQISILVETLEVCLPIESETGAYAERLQDLSNRVGELEGAKSQRERRAIVNDVLSGLEDLKKLDDDETKTMIIESAKMSISVVYDFFEKAFLQFKKVSASPEEISAYRLKKFSKYAGLIEAYDFSAWQKEREETVSQKWYSMKADWEKARNLDF